MKILLTATNKVPDLDKKWNCEEYLTQEITRELKYIGPVREGYSLDIPVRKFLDFLKDMISDEGEVIVLDPPKGSDYDVEVEIYNGYRE